MSILDNENSWSENFQKGWLAHLQQTGKFYWESYVRPKNQTPVAGPAINLSASRLMFISSAGGYLTGSQPPFDAGNPLGDYTARVFAADTPFENLAYAHEHYDHAAVNADPQVLLPLLHLQEMVAEGKIGALTSVVSFMGYQPDVSRLLSETIPAILELARAEKAQGALLVPA